MTVLIDDETKVLIQGITGKQGRFHAKLMRAAGTRVVAGVTPGKNNMEIHGIPVYDTIETAKKNHEIDASVLFVPAPNVKEAVMEAIQGGIYLVAIITEHVPAWDTAWIIEKGTLLGAKIIGPNCPGIISPGLAKLGIIPAGICKKGSVGIVSRSGTLTYEIIMQLSRAGIGQSTCIGIGGDPLHGLGFIDCLKLFEQDAGTEAIVLIGEIGGEEEQEATAFFETNGSKPLVAFIAGKTAPAGKQMGHAGAIVSGNAGSALAKIEMLEQAGIPVASQPSDIPRLLQDMA